MYEIKLYRFKIMIILNGFYIFIFVLVCVVRIFKIMFKIVKYCKMYFFYLFKVIIFDEIDNMFMLGLILYCYLFYFWFLIYI